MVVDADVAFGISLLQALHITLELLITHKTSCSTFQNSKNTFHPFSYYDGKRPNFFPETEIVPPPSSSASSNVTSHLAFFSGSFETMRTY